MRRTLRALPFMTVLPSADLAVTGDDDRAALADGQDGGAVQPNGASVGRRRTEGWVHAESSARSSRSAGYGAPAGSVQAMAGSVLASVARVAADGDHQFPQREDQTIRGPSTGTRSRRAAPRLPDAREDRVRSVPKGRPTRRSRRADRDRTWQAPETETRRQPAICATLSRRIIQPAREAKSKNEDISTIK